MKVDDEVWAAACVEEYQRAAQITFPGGTVLKGKEALDLYKFIKTKMVRGRPRAVNKPEDYFPKETKG